jgi:hypothetical protein
VGVNPEFIKKGQQHLTIQKEFFDVISIDISHCNAAIIIARPLSRLKSIANALQAGDMEVKG